VSIALIIDDDAAIRRIIRHVLASIGLEVIEAGNAEDGITLALGSLPQVIVMDIFLPGMSGLEAIEAIRNDPQLYHIPIVVITSGASSDVQRQAEAYGIDEFITKPFMPDYLREVFEKYLD
jgi:two-component system, cell cycle response regulator DivK